MEKRNENENRNRNQNPNRNSNKKKGRMAEKLKLKLISRHANINFKFAKRLQDNQQWGPRPGSTTASICPTVRHTWAHSMSWSWRRSWSRRRVATRVLQLVSHRFLAPASLPPRCCCLSALATRLMKCWLCSSKASESPAGQALFKQQQQQ